MPSVPLGFGGVTPGGVFARDFRILKPLSEGGMGTLFVAEQISTGRQRALKLMQPHLVSDPRSRQRFVQEARVSAQIESDHVVEVIGAGIDADTGIPWIAMELLVGEDLSVVASKRGAFDPREVDDIFMQLCHAVGAAHTAGVVHRDLKPENVFLASARRVGLRYHLKVLDFGIAKLTTEAKPQGTQSVGTPLWMAPEQTASGSSITPAADVWALGLIAFRLLSGSVYWLAADDPEAATITILREMLMTAIEPASARAARRPGSPRLPAGFDAWFAKCLDKNPAARFADANAAFNALEPVLKKPPSTGFDVWSPAPAADRASTLFAVPMEQSFTPSRPSQNIVELDLEPDSEGPAFVRDRVSGTPAPRSGTVAGCIAALQADPLAAGPCRDLLRLAHQSGAVDLRFRASTLLGVNGHATDEERRWSAIATGPPRIPLDGQMWATLAHRSLDPLLIAVFAAAAPALARATARSPRADAPRLEPSCWVDTRVSQMPLSQMFRAACAFIGIHEPALYVQASHRSAITAVHGDPVSIVVGAPLLEPLPHPRIVFTIARYLAALRPELYVPLFIGSTKSLRSAVTAILGMTKGGVSTNDPLAKSLSRLLAEHMRSEENWALRQATDALVRAHANLDVRAILRGAEITAARAALTLTNDLGQSCRALVLSTPRELSLEDLTKELLAYWISDDNGTVRRNLGIALAS